MRFGDCSISDTVNAYLEFLLIKNRGHEERVRQLLKPDPQAAQAEAVTFSFLRQQCLLPTVADIIGEGGIDFRCSPPHLTHFMLEVTSLDSEALSNQSGWLNVIEEGVGAFKLVTHILRRKASTKASQMANYPMPRILAFVSSHVGSDAFVGTLGAQSLMLSDIKLEVPVDSSEGPQQVTDLSNSVFIRYDEERKIVACRHSISAILLIALFEKLIKVVDMLHPEPRFPFEIRTFPEVPFLRLKTWPISDGKLETEWVIAHPESVLSLYGRFRDA